MNSVVRFNRTTEKTVRIPGKALPKRSKSIFVCDYLIKYGPVLLTNFLYQISCLS